MPRSIDFTVFGKVQGVYFRVFAKETADTAGLKGFVKNDPTGTVSGTVQGESHGLKLFEDAINRGPTAAQVTQVKITNERDLNQPEYDGFTIIRRHR